MTNLRLKALKDETDQLFCTESFYPSQAGLFSQTTDMSLHVMFWNSVLHPSDSPRFVSKHIILGVFSKDTP